MSLAKNFTDEQKATVQSWADSGDGLSDIQRKLADEMDVRVTYMELRFLIDDLGVKLPEPEAPAEPETKESADDDLPEGLDDDTSIPDGEGPVGDEAQVSISALQRPGALISGTVTFAGGNSAEWWLDQMGQLGMNPKGDDFQPSPEQMMSFQRELQAAVQAKGGF